MSLTLQEVEHIAELARLTLSEAEKEEYRGQLSAILDYAQRLLDLDTEGIPPTSSVLPPQSVLRSDEIKPSLGPETVLKNSKHTKDNQFQVPPVME
ncbi:MAG: Asp-tRNA(Asn)/Glu-tRNA(Gln) amidotransferase GatCAB subunit C [Anaerolineaceae bacterium]|nr:Asp-tRNA(Asn)/Glu-tRNA(Gln) amidotransferase GatCAB subunit C [Anaerolineaceae bacterium]